MAERFYICFYHDKRTYRSQNQAYNEVRRINNRKKNETEGDFRVFYCGMTGGYHHTSIDEAELMKRRLAAESSERKIPNHEHFEGQRRRLKRKAHRSPKVQARKQQGRR